MVEARKTRIGPIACYFEAFELLKSDYFLFWGIFFVAGLIAGAVPIVLQGPMFCGMIFALMAKQRGEPVEFNMIFKGFDWFVPSLLGALMCFLAQLIVTVPIMGITIPSMFVGIIGLETENTPMAISGFSAYGVCMIINVTIGLMMTSLIWFTCGLVVDRDMEGIDAFKLALSAIWKNKVELFLHSLVGVAITLVCYLMCLIPVFFAFPILLTAEYIAYVKVFGLSEPKSQFVETVQIIE